MDKKVIPACLVLLVLFIGIVGIMGVPAKAAVVTLPIVSFQPQCLKAANVRMEATDSTGNYEYTVNWDGTAKITKYLKEEKEVTVPSVLDGHPVTVIGREAFDLKRSVTSIQIPDTVKDIEGRAFSRTGIKEFTVPESVLRIGDRAFWLCEELQRIFISKNVEEIEGNIVEKSNMLTKINVDSHNVAYTSVDGILYNKDLTELLAVPGGKDLVGFRFPDSVVCIGEYAFCEYASEAVTELIIPDQVTTLGHGAFASCQNLQRVVIGKNIIRIPDNAFFTCCNLSEVVIKGNTKFIGNSAFLGCYNLAKINIPDTVLKIGERAFQDCHSLKNITLPKSVTQIGKRAFGFHEEGPYSDVCITGYMDTAVCQYAKKYHIVFRNIETSEDIRYDLLPVPPEKIKKLVARKKKIGLAYKEVEEASYQIAVKKAGEASWKRYSRLKSSAVIKGLEPGKLYKVKVRAVRELGGERYYGEWSKVKKVTVR